MLFVFRRGLGSQNILFTEVNFVRFCENHLMLKKISVNGNVTKQFLDALQFAHIFHEHINKPCKTQKLREHDRRFVVETVHSRWGSWCKWKGSTPRRRAAREGQRQWWLSCREKEICFRFYKEGFCFLFWKYCSQFLTKTYSWKVKCSMSPSYL